MKQFKHILLRKLLTKSTISLVLSILMLIHPYGIAAGLVYAEENAAQEEVQQEQSETPPKEPSSSQEESNNSDGQDMDTGNAEAGASGTTEVNTNDTEVPGDISTGCEAPEGDCPDSISVEIDNQADVDTDTTADANTGINQQSETEADASMETGDAGAGADTQNLVNTNTAVLNPDIANSDLETATDSATPVATDSASINNGPTIIETSIENTNEADVDSDTLAGANTGINSQSDISGDASMDTGDAIASSNSLNVINTNLTGSDIQFILIDIYAEDLDVNLYESWQNFNLDSAEIDENGVIQIDDGINLRIVTISNDNLASLNAETIAIANTGENQQTDVSKDTLMFTGDALAAANSVSFVNTNITGSNFFAIIINIFGIFTGNIIIPNPEYTQENPSSELLSTSDDSGNNQINFVNTNSAEVETNSQAESITGSNEQSDIQANSQIETGEAYSIANAFSVVNTNIFANTFYHILINNFGGWLGQILGWETPVSAGDAQEGALDLSEGDPLVEGSEGLGGNNLGITNFTNQNQAYVYTNTFASANTGNNLQNNIFGNAVMFTGNAFSIANAVNFVNTNIFGSNFLLGFINVLGEWTGDLIFAHPDLTISINSPQEEVTPGEEVIYTVTVINQGTADAADVTVKNAFPDQLVHQQDSLEPTSDNGSDRTWWIGNLRPGQSADFTITTSVDPEVRPDESPISYTVSVGGEKEEDMSNNSDTEVDKVVFSTDGEEGEEGEEAPPELFVSSWNNVAEYVLSGDTVIVEITVENTGDGSSYDTILSSLLFNDVPGPIGGGDIELGTIKPHQRIIATFELPLNGEIGDHELIVWAVGKSKSGEEVTSNETATSFLVKVASFLNDLVSEAQASEGDILGSTNNVCENKRDWLPYLLAASFAALWGIDQLKRRYPWLATLPLKRRKKDKKD